MRPGGDSAIWDPAKKVADAARDVERHIFETNVKPRIAEAIVEEHRANPFGRHGSDLEIVLRYLRRDLARTAPRYLIVSEVPYGQYCVGEHARVPGAPVAVTDECYESEEEAQHAIFVRRLRALGDPDVDRVLERAT